MKMWDGRFKKSADERLNDFNSSISFDSRMYAQDIAGSCAHAAMLAKQGIITTEDAQAIIDGLKAIKNDIESTTLTFDATAEDIHMFIEAELTARIGDAGKRLHTARSRNDQVATDFRLYCLDAIEHLETMIIALIEVLNTKSEANLHTVMCGYTHLQRAQPITFAHHLVAYTQMLLRDLKRLETTKQMTKVLPLGSGALATTTYPIDRQFVATELGFDEVALNSLDGVSDRDFAIDLAYDIAMTMMHLSRFSEEIILWSSWEFKYIELDDAFATGSSIMPQKKNPDICELIRGKTGRCYGDLTTLLTMMKNLPLAYNKDMQEDKEALFDAYDTLLMCLETLTPMVSTMQVIPENMAKAAQKGFINATDCADYLTKKGVPFRDAYHIVGKLVAYCNEHNQVLETLSLAEYQQASPIFENDIYEAINLINCVNKRNVIGGPAPEQVKATIEATKTALKEFKYE